MTKLVWYHVAQALRSPYVIYLIFTTASYVGAVRIPTLQMRDQALRGEVTFLVNLWRPGAETIAV